MNGRRLSTADLCDEFFDVLRFPDLALRRFGGVPAGAGRAALVDLDADNRILFEVLAQSGRGKALVVRSRSPACPAVVGATLVALAVKNDWECLVIDGALRDVAQVRHAPMCVYAREQRPFRLRAGPAGRVLDQLDLVGTPIRSGDLVTVDEDGIIVGRPSRLPPWLSNGETAIERRSPRRRICWRLRMFGVE
ncbi:RraA family protein [Amycolatopsis pigmentata]|uniref:Putative 4-hydroxy-4-methyl-2-oxoglutarate aldolase n=1 Tax=Amycolatopsis pigmentata TaxID=450801 RepID=A0ABW5FIV5_9PSEU